MVAVPSCAASPPPGTSRLERNSGASRSIAALASAAEPNSASLPSRPTGSTAAASQPNWAQPTCSPRPRRVASTASWQTATTATAAHTAPAAGGHTNASTTPATTSA